MLVIGVSIGGSHVTASGVNMSEGKILKGTTFSQNLNAQASQEEIIKIWASQINKTIHALRGHLFRGIAFAMPGAFNYREGIALFKDTNKYEDLFNEKIEALLNPHLLRQHLEFRFINDATAFGMGEAWKGMGRHAQRIICLTLGTGIGSAFIENGLPVVNRADVPPEGCLWHLPYREERVEDFFSLNWFKSQAEQMKLPILGVKDLADRFAYSPKVRNIFDEFGDNLAELLAPWIESFGPELLVFGGNVSKSLPFFRSALDQKIRKLGCRPGVVGSRLMDEAAILGCTKVFEEQCWEEIIEELPLI